MNREDKTDVYGYADAAQEKIMQFLEWLDDGGKNYVGCNDATRICLPCHNLILAIDDTMRSGNRARERDLSQPDVGPVRI